MVTFQLKLKCSHFFVKIYRIGGNFCENVQRYITAQKINEYKRYCKKINAVFLSLPYISLYIRKSFSDIIRYYFAYTLFRHMIRVYAVGC